LLRIVDLGRYRSHSPPLTLALSQKPRKQDRRNPTALRWFFLMRSVPYEFVQSLAAEFGAVECFWRESERSFTGFVAEVWFESLPSAFAVRWSAVVGYSVLVRSVSAGPARFAVSVPVVVPGGVVRLCGGSRGGRVRVRLVR